MIWFGVILIAVGIGLSVGHLMKRKKLAVLQGIDRKKAGELQDLAKAVGGEIGGGSFREMVELVGEIVCERPLESPLGKRPCVYYEMTVRREYEEEYFETDKQGNRNRRTRRGSEVVSSNKENREFALKDESGQVLVLPDGAEFDSLVQTVSRFEPAPSSGASISFGGFSFSLGSTSDRRTLGFKYEEALMPVDRRVTIVGQVSDADGRLAVRRGGEQFIVSTKSKEEMVAGVKSAALVFLIAGIVAVAAGIGLTVAGIASTN